MRFKYWVMAEAGDGTNGGAAGGTAMGDPPATPPAADPPAGTGTPPAGDPPAGTGTPPAGDPPAGDPPADLSLSADTWREFIADGDEKSLARLQRFNNVRDVFKQNREFERRLSSGELRLNPKEGATPEEMTRWRQEMGVPASAADYKLEVGGEALTGLDDSSEEMYAPLKQAALDANLTQSQWEAMISADSVAQTQVIDRRQNADKALAGEVTQQLKDEWGKDYDGNRALIRTAVDRAGEGIYEALMNGRMADGTPIGSHVAVLNWLANMEREINPAGDILPGSSAVTINTVNEEINELKQLMGDKSSEYWKGPNAVKNQERYQALIDAQLKLKSRGG